MSTQPRLRSSSKGFLLPIISKFCYYSTYQCIVSAFKFEVRRTCRFLSTRGQDWSQPKRTCNGEAQPLAGSSYPAGEPPAAAVVNKVLMTMKSRVFLLDITTLSQLRKDAHPSTYGGGGGTDCSHWCLPGLPDTWNQLLYAALIS